MLQYAGAWTLVFWAGVKWSTPKILRILLNSLHYDHSMQYIGPPYSAMKYGRKLDMLHRVGIMAHIFCNQECNCLLQCSQGIWFKRGSVHRNCCKGYMRRYHLHKTFTYGLPSLLRGTKLKSIRCSLVFRAPNGWYSSSQNCIQYTGGLFHHMSQANMQLPSQALWESVCINSECTFLSPKLCAW